MTTRSLPTLMLALSILLVGVLACSLGRTATVSESSPSPTVAPATSEQKIAADTTPAGDQSAGQPTVAPATPEQKTPADITPAGDESASQPTAPANPPQYDTVFPLPDDVQNFQVLGGEGMINFQTNLSMQEVIAFYRQRFAEKGLTERTILTEINDSGFSMVFDGWGNGKAVVIQGVDFGSSVNVNIRFEEV